MKKMLALSVTAGLVLLAPVSHPWPTGIAGVYTLTERQPDGYSDGIDRNGYPAGILGQDFAVVSRTTPCTGNKIVNVEPRCKRLSTVISPPSI